MNAILNLRTKMNNLLREQELKEVELDSINRRLKVLDELDKNRYVQKEIVDIKYKVREIEAQIEDIINKIQYGDHYGYKIN
jgi:DNA repair ATPase RecN